MGTHIGLFKFESTGDQFRAVATPVNFVAACGIELDAPFEVDWGDGTFISYAASRQDVVPTGNITVKSNSTPTHFRFHTNTYSAIDVQACSTITSMQQSFSFLLSMTSLSITGSGNVTNFQQAFQQTRLTSFPLIDTSAGTNFTNCWNGCVSTTSFAALDLSAGTNFTGAWVQCVGLTTFPSFNLSAGTNFTGAWLLCSFTTFPALDLSAGTDFSRAWESNTSLTSMGLVNTAAALNLTDAWKGCSALTSFPLINTATVTNMDAAWNGCSGLTGFPLINTGAVTNFNTTWNGCSGLAGAFPAINTAAGTTFVDTFNGCNSLTSFSTMNTSAGTSFARMFNITGTYCLTNLDTTGNTAGANSIFGSRPQNMSVAEETALESAAGATYTNASACP